MQAVKALTGSVRLSAPVVSATPAQTVDRPVAADSFARIRTAKAALQAPPSFTVDGKKVVFTDITNVDTAVVFDVKAQKSSVKAVVDFDQIEKGRPVIELSPTATKVIVDGKEIDAKSYSDVSDPANESKLRIIDAELAQGKHRVEIEYELTNGVRFSGDSVEFFARKSDLDDRSMDEQYFPTNLEYDQYPGKQTFEVRGTDVKHRLMSNGDVSDVGGKMTVTFPPQFNTASRFLNVINPANFAIYEDTFQSVKGAIPMVLYTPGNLVEGDAPFGHGAGIKHQPGEQKTSENLSAEERTHRGIEIAKAALAKHEKDFGAYPHPRVLIRISGSGGMEYSGATESDTGSLPHELHHQWFARSAQPANGNAGWIDEACASWHDHGYNSASSPPSWPRKLSGFPAWHRITPQAAYSHGADVIAYLDHVFAAKGGMRPVLAKFFTAYTKQVFTTEQFLGFIKDQGQASGISFDFDAFFKAQVYGTRLTQMRRR